MNHKLEMKLRSNFALNRGRIVSCTPKKRFKNYEIACLVSRNTNIRNKETGRDEIVVPYKCPFCTHWHVGKRMEYKKLRSVPLVIK